MNSSGSPLIYEVLPERDFPAHSGRRNERRSVIRRSAGMFVATAAAGTLNRRAAFGRSSFAGLASSEGGDGEISPYDESRQEDIAEEQAAVNGRQGERAQGVIRVDGALQVRRAHESGEVHHEGAADRQDVPHDSPSLRWLQSHIRRLRESPFAPVARHRRPLDARSAEVLDAAGDGAARRSLEIVNPREESSWKRKLQE